MRYKLILLLSIFIHIAITSQDVELRKVNAKDEFKWGVKFYNQGLYEKSVFSFERSLSFDSSDFNTHLWLGHAYYMKGDVEAALKEWSLIQSNGTSPVWLDSAIEIISAGRGVINKLYSPNEWVPLYSKDFKRPSSLLALENGSVAIVSFMSNKLSFINTNGAVIDNINGGIEPFNRPFDVIRDDKDGFIVSEFMGDKVSFVNSIGIKTKIADTEDNPLSGPQYLTKDNKGYFYVSDWGNKRVCKFDMEGNLILTISNSLLKGPSGVLALGDNIYVADQLNRTVLLFDSSGNYLETLIDEGLDGPEGLSPGQQGSILIADGTSLKEYRIQDKTVSLVSDLQGKGSRITKGVIDSNGNVLATDFNLNEFYALTDVSSLYGGLYININRINIMSFPKIQMDIQVFNRLGEPIIGLDNTNFLVSEGSRIVPSRNIIFKGNDNNAVSMGIIFDLDTSMQPYFESFYDVTKSVYSEREPGDRFTLVKAGGIPSIIATPQDNPLEAVSDFSTTDFESREGLDLSLKLAASSLIPSRDRRELVLITSGEIKEEDFVKYSLDEIRNFLVNNRISLSVIYVGQKVNEELEYIVEETGGISKYLFKGAGSKGILSDCREKKSGFYVIEYDSLGNIDNGEIYTPVELEVNYIRKSGRSEIGYFVPVKVVE